MFVFNDPWCLTALLSLSTLVNSYSFQFDNTPQQCGNVSISITGSGGTPPYRLSIVPWGGSPLGNLEVRHVMDIPFNDSSHVNFVLPFPADSQFVAVVSDNNGQGSNFGTGGVTVPVNVIASSTNSCLPTVQSKPDFFFSLSPQAALTTCQTILFEYSDSDTQGTVDFWGILLGGDAFLINGGSQPTDYGNGTSSVSWVPDVTPGVNILVVAGDNRGFGAGGSFQGSMQPGNGTTSCVNGNSPVSTPGSPAGGSYPTNNSGGTTSGGGSKTNIGGIVGGVVGGVAAIAIIGIIAFLLLRRRRTKSRYQERPVDLLDGRGGEHGDGDENTPPRIPEQYIPEPFHIPDSSTYEMSEASAHARPGAISAENRPVSSVSATTQTRLSSEGGTSSTPWRTSTTKSLAGPTALRPVNVIQHEDAGPSENAKSEDDTAETVELPPAYTNLRK